MGFRFRKSIKLAPGVRINLTKKGVSSVSVGKRGATVNISKKGTRGTLGVPGSGLSYSSYKKHGKSSGNKNQPSRSAPVHGHDNDIGKNTSGYAERKVSVWLALGIVMVPIIFAWFTLRQGHSTVSRVVSMAWMVITIFMLR